MADPRIRYDILANAEGEEDVGRLAAELEKLDEAINPQAAARAKALAEEMRALAEKRTGIEAFLRALAEADAAAKALENAQQAADKLGRRLEAVEKPTRQQVGQQEKLRDAVERTQRALTEKTAALSTARVGIERLGVGTTDLGTKQQLLATALASTKTQAAQLGAAYQATAAQAAASAATQTRAQGQVKGALEDLTGTYRRLQSIAAVAIGGGIFTGLISDVGTTADAYKNLESRIKLVTGEGPAFERAFQGVADIALRTNTSLETTGTLFTRIAQAGRDIGLTQQGALALTETINQTLALSGASAASSDAAITQLIQGLQSGVLRGEEFNSVVEQSPRLAQALADGLGVARGELRKLANEGQLTSEVVIKALEGQAGAVQREFATLPLTVGRAVQNLSNSWTLYVGEVDKANGVSAAAAGFINGLANNLDTLATVLLAVGKAAAAYKVLKMAQEFLGISTAAKAATAAVTALSAAQAGATGLADAAAASTGRYAAVLSSLKAFSLVGVLANAETIGTAIGEGVAKLAGYGKVLEENERLLAAEERAARSNAAATAEVAAQALRAADAKLGLGKEAKTLVADFDQVVKKGESVADALAKVAKSLQLEDISGIAAAGAAMDSLALSGKITADQVTATLGASLKNLDLGTFEAKARAAFDTSEQGARRLQAAIDAVADEALRRAGTSAQELKTGFSAAATSAINDVDALAASLLRVGADAQTSGRLLAGSLDKALSAASTERAVQAVIQRMEALGKQGSLTGEQLVDGLEKARKKLDELKPGVNSLAEAYRQFGLKSQKELQALADKNKQAWQVIRTDATLSLSQKQAAFKQYAESAILANGGVASSELKLQAASLKVQLQVDQTGKTIVSSMAGAETAVQRATKRFDELGREVNEAGEAVNQLAGKIGDPRLNSVRQPGTAGAQDAQGNLPQIDSFGRLIRGTPNGGITRTAQGQIPPPPGDPADYFFNTARRGEGPFGLGVWELTPEGAARQEQRILNPSGPPARPAPVASGRVSSNDAGRVAGGQGAGASATAATSVRTVRLELAVAGRTFPVMADESIADGLLSAIERAKSTGG